MFAYNQKWYTIPDRQYCIRYQNILPKLSEENSAIMIRQDDYKPGY